MNAYASDSVLKTEVLNQLRLIESHVKSRPHSDATLEEVKSELTTVAAKLKRNSTVGNPANCAGRVAKLRPGWSPSNLKDACEGVNSDCAVMVAKTNMGWSPDNVHSACEGNPENCAGELAVLRRGWSPSNLKDACENEDKDCIVDLAKTNPGWSPSNLSDACSK